MTKTTKVTTSIMFIAVLSLLTTSLSYHPQDAFASSVVDFEGLCSSSITDPISTIDNDVTLQVGTSLAGAQNGYAVTVGGTQEAFLSTPSDTPHNSDGTEYSESGDCFFSDDIRGFRAGFNYYISFANPVDTLSIDLYDYSDDGNFNGDPSCVGNNACDGHVATLTVYDDLAQTSIVGTGTYTVDAANWFDGQVGNLSVIPGASFISASITFSHIDRGTGIDNISFDTTPQVETVEIDVKPGSDPSSWSCKNTKGSMPVAVFGSESFDVETIDLDSLSFAYDGTEVSVEEVHGEIHVEDKNGDEYPDGVLHLDSAGVCEATADAPLKETVDVTLSGTFGDDQDFEGLGDIRIVNNGNDNGNENSGKGNGKGKP